jgi:hypothetical protein
MDEKIGPNTLYTLVNQTKGKKYDDYHSNEEDGERAHISKKWSFCNLIFIYLVNILHKVLMYPKYTLISLTIILMPFMLITIFKYTCNMVVHTHSKYTFINPNTPNYIPYNSQNAPLYIHKVVTKLVTFTTKGTYIVFLG